MASHHRLHILLNVYAFVPFYIELLLENDPSSRAGWRFAFIYLLVEAAGNRFKKLLVNLVTKP